MNELTEQQYAELKTYIFQNTLNFEKLEKELDELYSEEVESHLLINIINESFEGDPQLFLEYLELLAPEVEFSAVYFSVSTNCGIYMKVKSEESIEERDLENEILNMPSLNEELSNKKHLAIENITYSEPFKLINLFMTEDTDIH